MKILKNLLVTSVLAAVLVVGAGSAFAAGDAQSKQITSETETTIQYDPGTVGT